MNEFSVSFVVSGSCINGDLELNQENLYDYIENVLFKEGVFNSSDCEISEIDVEQSEDWDDGES